jgi:ATP-binding cassette subfamily B protein
VDRADVRLPPGRVPLDRDLRQALGFIAPYWRRLLLVVLLSLVSTALALYLPYLSKDLIDGALVARDLDRLWRIVLLFGLVTLAAFGVNVASGLRYTRVSADVLFDMRAAVYRHLQRLSPRFYARTRLGDIVARLNNDIAEIQRVAAETLLASAGNALFLCGTLIMMVWLDPRLFILSVSVLPLSVWALSRWRRRLADRVADVRQASADVGSFLIETLQGMKLVTTSNAQAREADRFRARNDAFVRALMRMQLASYLAGGVPGLVLAGGTMLVFGYGGSRVIAGDLTLGTFVAFMAYQMRLFPPVQGLMGLYAALATVKVSLHRVREIAEAPVEIVERPDAGPLPQVRGDLAVEGVTVAYDRGTTILDRVSFSLRAGESLAVVGPSGSGKSTLADLLLRLIDPDEGRVTLDGHDLRDLRLDDLRRHIVLVDQEPFLFNTSIAENIRYARSEASDAEVAGAARAAGLEAFVATLPDGLETAIGERGLALSAGERQRIAIARALLADPAVLVLDEATASLDPVVERQVVAGYEAAMTGRTTIIISHRRQMALRADRVLVLREARVAEHGDPRELLRNPDGAFAVLFRES